MTRRRKRSSAPLVWRWDSSQLSRLRLGSGFPLNITDAKAKINESLSESEKQLDLRMAGRPCIGAGRLPGASTERRPPGSIKVLRLSQKILLATPIRS